MPGDRFRLLHGRYLVAASERAGRVTPAFDLRLRRDVVLKASPAGADLGEEFRLLRTHAHPGLPQALDFHQGDDRRDIVEERVFGRSLADLTATLAVEELALVADRLASALAFLHRSGVLHRDVKPANVILRSGAPPGEEVKLLDLDLAVRTAAAGLAEAAGTKPFVAPEVEAGVPPSPASDFYGLGATLAALHPDASHPLRPLVQALCATTPAARPVTPEAVRALLPVPVPLPAPSSGGRAIIVREEPLRQLFDRWQAALGGGRDAAAVVHVVGPAGRGKRTLIELFGDEVRLSGGVVVSVEPGERMERDLARAVTAALAGVAATHDPGADPVPALLELGRRTPTAVLVPVAPAAGQPRHELVARLGAAIAGARRTGTPSRMLLVLAADEPAFGANVQLAPWTLDETAALLRSAVPREVAAEEVALVHGLSAGEPALIRAIAGTLAAGQASGPREQNLDVVVRRTIALLTPGAATLLAAAAIASEPLPEVAWEPLAGDRRAVEELLRSGLVRERDGRLVPAHATVRVEAAGLAVVDSVHGRLVAALAPHEAAHPELLAAELLHAGEAASSHRVAREAAARARAQGDRRSAYFLYVWAIDRAGLPPNGAEAEILAEAIDVALWHGDPQNARRWAERLAATGAPTARQRLLHARALLFSGERIQSLAVLEALHAGGAEGDPAVRLDTIIELARLMATKRDRDRALALCEEGDHLDPQPEQRDALAFVRAGILMDTRKAEEARALYEALLGRALSAGDRIKARRNLAVMDLAQGRPDVARPALLALLEQARVEGAVRRQELTLQELTSVANTTGRYAEAFALIDDWKAIFDARGEASASVRAILDEVALRLSVADVDGAEALLADLGLRNLSTPERIHSGLLRVEARLQRGTPEALTDARLALATAGADGPGTKASSALAHIAKLLRGRMALEEGDAQGALRQAEAVLEDARDTTHQWVEARLLEAKARLALGAFQAQHLPALQQTEQLARKRGLAEPAWELAWTLGTAYAALDETTRARMHASRARGSLRALLAEVPERFREAYRNTPLRREVLGPGDTGTADGRVVTALDEVLGVVERYLVRPKGDLDAALDEVLGEAIRLTGAERGGILLGDGLETLRIARVHAVIGRRYGSIADLSRTALAAVMERGETLVVGDASADPTLAPGESARRLNLRSVLATPLGGGQERILGALYLEHTRRAHLFDEIDREALQRLGRSLGAILAHALRTGVSPDQALKERFPFVRWTSPAMGRVVAEVAQVAALDEALLLTGETGVGKDILAQVYAAASRRRSILPVNCATLQATLAEGILFGVRRGGYTNAEHREGLFERADGGILFLNEIGTLADEVQDKLLGVIETGEFLPVGASEERKSDVVVVAATDRISFLRPPLFHRLDRFRVEVPPLRERPEDIEPLFRHFLHEAASRYSLPVPKLGKAFFAGLAAEPWPGNVRDLANRAARIAAGLATMPPGDGGKDGDGAIGAAGQDGAVADEPPGEQITIPEGHAGFVLDLTEPVTMKFAVDRFKGWLVRETYVRAGARGAETARRLAVDRRTIWSWLPVEERADPPGRPEDPVEPES